MSETTDLSTCFHCGDDIPTGAHYPIRYRKREENACCAGCQAVAQTIIDSGLGSYYEQREKPAGKATPLPTDILEQVSLYDEEAVQKSFVKAEPGQIREAALILEGITCAACIWLNEKHLHALPGVLEAQINYSTHRARIRWDNSKISLSSILRAISDIGYQAHPYDAGRQDELYEQERKTALNRLWIAALSMMQVMMYAVPAYLADDGVIGAEFERLMQWASFILTTPVVFYSSLPFYRGTWSELKRGRVGMDTPVAIGVLTSFAASFWATITQQGAVYYDSISMFVFLLLGGRYLEMLARRKAGEATESLIKLIPAFTHTLPDYPRTSTPKAVSVVSLALGDIVLVRPGDTIPCDGIVLEGESATNESLLTGESRPVSKTRGDYVIAGSINTSTPLTIEVQGLGQETQLAGIVRLLDRALQQKPKLAELADRVAAWFVLALLLTAAGTWIYWHIADPDKALWILVSVLVISCPCALSLATPAALTAATGRLSQLKLLLTRGRALEALAGADTVVLDKTGTLTFGQPKCIRVEPFGISADEAYQLAATLEAGSEHPIALAFKDKGETLGVEIHKRTSHAGQGVEASIQGTTYRIGTLKYVSELALVKPPDSAWEPEYSHIYLAKQGQLLARFALGDTLRPDAPQVISAIQQRGLEVHILSGDQQSTVNTLANSLHITTAKGNQLPQDKLAYIQDLQKHGRKVLMIGDGVNDAPVMAAAHVSVAMGSGTEVAQNSADIVLLGQELAPLLDGLNIAKRSRQIIRQNLFWALLYNAVAIPFACAGLITPWLASLGMAISSLVVVGNALRILSIGKTA